MYHLEINTEYIVEYCALQKIYLLNYLCFIKIAYYCLTLFYTFIKKNIYFDFIVFERITN